MRPFSPDKTSLVILSVREPGTIAFNRIQQIRIIVFINMKLCSYHPLRNIFERSVKFPDSLWSFSSSFRNEFEVIYQIPLSKNGFETASTRRICRASAFSS
jgi:hypothetical protein